MLQRYELNNGLKVVEEQMDGVRSVSIGIWILTGSRNEPENINGISHLIEHMLFKGTDKRSPKDIAEAFDKIGGQVNAFTSKEYTCLYARVMDQHAEEALEVLSDMILNSKFVEEELEREKKVVLEEILMTEDDPDDIIHDYLHEVSFESHPLSQSILGSREALHNLSRSDIINYMERYYTSERMVVSIAGNVPVNFRDKVSTHLGDIRSNDQHEDSMKTIFTSGNVDKTDDTSQSHLCIGYNGYPIGTDEVLTVSVLNNVLGGSMSSRMFQQVREEKGLSYAIFSFHNPFRDNGLLTIYSATAPDQLEEMEAIINSIIDDIKLNGITDQELTNTIQQLKGQLVLGLENPSSRMNRNGRNELLQQPHLTLDELITKLEQVSHADIKKIANEMFNSKPARALISPESI
ncbi:M16 family metallopeptidase [Alkalibacillus haloalkaliphilus]|uniref:M16 family metallopeptidase n=1 Tax=Alkalibacillus haloalkaliphilus TaxID=94136 RepID=UPI00031B7625|nr:pitrilysin family protein [Alkalibacillus haloalkaliphilus]